jgi:hypothetical protein
MRLPLLPIAAALLVIALMAAGASAQQQLGAANYSSKYANATLADATAYVQSVNESGYLIFYPNMTQADAYLAKAAATYNTSPSASVIYSEEAQAAAREQYGSISRYRETSFAVMAILSAFSAVVVAVSMRKAGGAGKLAGRG